MANACDVTFGCFAQSKGLELVGVKGMLDFGDEFGQRRTDQPLIYRNMMQYTDMMGSLYHQMHTEDRKRQDEQQPIGYNASADYSGPLHWFIPIAQGAESSGSKFAGQGSLRPRTAPIEMLTLMRTGRPGGARVRSIRETWAQDLERDSLVVMEPDDFCKQRYGDNHGKGLTCLEAQMHLKIMNRTDWQWVLVVDDDVFVFAERFRATLRTIDPHVPEVYGLPGCGDCGGGRKGFCGGGGYIISRQNLLKMTNFKMTNVTEGAEAPLSNDTRDGFLEHFMRPPMSNWCDVRFGCVAQDVGLKLKEVRGLYMDQLKVDEKETVALESARDPPLVLHAIREAAHMERLWKESKAENLRHEGRTIKHYAQGSRRYRWRK